MVTVLIFILGTFSLGLIIPAKDISLTQSLLVGFDNYFHYLHISWAGPIIAIALMFGVLAGVLTWVAGPSKGIFAVGKAGYLPPFFQKTNKNGVQLNILIIQGCIVTLLSSLYIVMDDVSVAFFLLSALTVGLYLIMYMMMYAAGIRLRYTQPKLIRSYRVPGGNTGMWLLGGVGFLAVLFSFIVTFFPPSQLPVGSPATYMWLVVTGTTVFLAIPFIISFAMDKRKARRTPEA